MLKLYAKAKTLLWDPRGTLRDLKEDTEGATIIEYSLLIGLITVAVVATVVLVGAWVAAKWVALDTALP